MPKISTKTVYSMLVGAWCNGYSYGCWVSNNYVRGNTNKKFKRKMKSDIKVEFQFNTSKRAEESKDKLRREMTEKIKVKK